MSKELPEHNPFASPMTDERPAVPGAIEPTEAERIRKEYIKHEASIRSFGILYYLGVFILALYTIGAIFFSLSTEASGLLGIGIAVICGFLAMAQWWVARGLRKLNGSVRIWAIVLAVPWLINVPTGTIISIYIIYLLASAKGKYIMTPEYQEIRAATPHIKYKTSKIVWVFLGLLVLLIVFGIVAAFIGA